MFSNRTLQQPLHETTENPVAEQTHESPITDNSPAYMKTLQNISGLDKNEIKIALDKKEREVSDEFMRDPPNPSECNDINEEITMTAFNRVKEDFENGKINGEEEEVSADDMTNLDGFENPFNDQAMNDFSIAPPELQSEVDQIMTDIDSINSSEEFAEPAEESPMLGFDELDKLAEPEDDSMDFPPPEDGEHKEEDDSKPTQKMPNDSAD